MAMFSVHLTAWRIFLKTKALSGTYIKAARYAGVLSLVLYILVGLVDAGKYEGHEKKIDGSLVIKTLTGTSKLQCVHRCRLDKNCKRSFYADEGETAHCHFLADVTVTDATNDEGELGTLHEPVFVPVDGRFTKWSQWSGCSSSSCKSRTRTCIPPINGGKNCVGGTKETTRCADSRFRFIEPDMTWYNGRTHCQSLGGDLAVFLNKTQQDNAMTCADNRLHWIGVTDEQDEGTWAGVDGSLITWKQVNSDGDGDCVCMNKNQWYDDPCTNKRPFICA